MSYEPTKPCKLCLARTYEPLLIRGACPVCRKAEVKATDRKSYTKHRCRKLVRNAARRAAKQGVPFDLDGHADALQARMDAGVCELTGLPFRLDNAQAFAWDSPSIDRIRPTEGYVIGNVRVILYGMNAAMGQWGLATLLKMTSAL